MPAVPARPLARAHPAPAAATFMCQIPQSLAAPREMFTLDSLNSLND